MNIKKIVIGLSITYLSCVGINIFGHSLNADYVKYLEKHSDRNYQELEKSWEKIFKEVKSSKILIPGSVAWRWVEISKDLTKKLDK